MIQIINDTRFDPKHLERKATELYDTARKDLATDVLGNHAESNGLSFNRLGNFARHIVGTPRLVSQCEWYGVEDGPISDCHSGDRFLFDLSSPSWFNVERRTVLYVGDYVRHLFENG